MRNYNSVFHARNALTGVLCASAAVEASCQGQSIDTIGFLDLVAVLCAASLKGSGATDTACDLAVKFQEASTAAATGADWTDITAGAINGTATVQGSAKFDTVQIVAGSVVAQEPFKQRKLYMLLNDQSRKRYIRALAAVTGTTAKTMEVAVSVAVLLGRPRESAYIIDAVSMGATSHADVYYGFRWGSTPGM